jgi:hypothetical protein
MRLLVLATAVGLGACGIVGLGEDERLGVIEFYRDTTVVSVPSNVRADASFGVTFHTFGGGCVRAGHTDVEVEGSIATVTPVDIHSGGDACTAELALLSHEASIVFRSPGPATIVVRGRVQPADTVAERSFTVAVEQDSQDRE